MMRTIVVTGGIGSGKSAVCSYLAGKGVPVYDTDSRAKQLYYTDKVMVGQIEEHFGISLFDSEGKLARKTISDLIFSDAQNLEALESFVHPAVLRDFVRWRNEKEKEPWCGYGGDIPFVCMESAIVLDKPVFKDIYDYVLVVDAPLEIRLERAVLRDSSSCEKIMERMKHQNIPVDMADVVIVNDGSLDLLVKRVDQAIRIINL